MMTDSLKTGKWTCIFNIPNIPNRFLCNIDDKPLEIVGGKR